MRQKLYPISKNIKRQNRSELVFEDISTFDAENPIVGSLLKELDIGKKNLTSNLVEKTPRPLIFDDYLKNKLNKLKDRPKPKDDDDNNNNLSPPSSPLSFPPPPPPQPP